MEVVRVLKPVTQTHRTANQHPVKTVSQHQIVSKADQQDNKEILIQEVLNQALIQEVQEALEV